MVSQALRHYRMMEKIGGGGMGVVYRAHDDRLDRDVAIKILPPGTLHDEVARKRFRTEALALSKLNHPNIATIHDFDTVDGTDFLVMELVKGQTLTEMVQHGAMPENDVLAVAMQIAQALEEAHEHGVIHRDLKPGNVMMTQKGQVKVLDFGLAKYSQALGDAAHTESLSQQQLAGTLPYMAPEQLRGLRADQRSDIYALGMVVYEAATGRRPFDDKLPTALADSILHTTPPPPGRLNPKISPQLEYIILKCLEKAPENRYQSAKDVQVDLRRLKRDAESSGTIEKQESSTGLRFPRTRWFSSAAVISAVALLLAAGAWWMTHSRSSSQMTGRQATVAVLPFQNMGSDKTRDFLRFAVPDEVVSTLSYIPSLAIRPFSATQKYTGEAIDLQSIGHELRVADIVTGRYLQEGDTLRVTVEATDVENNRLIWQQTVSGSVADMIALQDQISARVREGMVPALGVSASLAPSGPRPKNPEAYDLYQRSLALPADTASNQEGISLLQRAVGLDPGYASAWAELGHLLYYEIGIGEAANATRLRAKAALQRAVALDPGRIEAAADLISMESEEGDLNRSYDDITKLLHQRPDSGAVHMVHSYVLWYAGLLDEAASECEKTHSLDAGTTDLATCGHIFAALGKYERAREYLQLQSGTEYARQGEVEILLREGRLDEALQQLKSLPMDAAYGRQLLEPCLQHRPPTKAEAVKVQQLHAGVMATPDPGQKYALAEWDSFCGKPDSAYRALRLAIAQNYCAYPQMETDPLLVKIRALPEFAEVRASGIACRQRFLEHKAKADRQ
jgi:serine/threonine protein kinase/tetratricopeptide (TPR) repeat protein